MDKHSTSNFCFLLQQLLSSRNFWQTALYLYQTLISFKYFKQGELLYCCLIFFFPRKFLLPLSRIPKVEKVMIWFIEIIESRVIVLSKTHIRGKTKAYALESLHLEPPAGTREKVRSLFSAEASYSRALTARLGKTREGWIECAVIIRRGL